jgi:predicted lactoylglutathione lyase
MNPDVTAFVEMNNATKDNMDLDIFKEEKVEEPVVEEQDSSKALMSFLNDKMNEVDHMADIEDHLKLYNMPEGEKETLKSYYGLLELYNTFGPKLANWLEEYYKKDGDNIPWEDDEKHATNIWNNRIAIDLIKTGKFKSFNKDMTLEEFRKPLQFLKA